MRSDRLPRTLRGLAAAALATFTALFGHLAGGGITPGWIGILAPLVLSAPLAILLVGRRPNPVRIMVAVLAAQAAFHILFVLGTPQQVVTTTGAHHHELLSFAVVGGGSPALSVDPAMLLGHALGAALTSLALARGERALHALLALARRAVAAVLPSSVAPPAISVERALVPLAPAAERSPLAVLLRATPRRGPPLVALL